MRVLVTGGAGFIGSHLVEHFQGKAEVRVLDDLRTGYRHNLEGFQVEFIEGSVRDADVVARSMEGVDYVYHLAAMVSVPESIERPDECRGINAEGTLVVLEEAARAGVKKVVLSSSCALYGDNPVSPKHEELTPEPLSPYAQSKLDAEVHCERFRREGRIQTACLRYFNVYGPRQDPESDYAAVIPLFIDRARGNRTLAVYGDGEQTRDFVFVKDVVGANEHAATHEDVAGVYNVACGGQTSVNDLARLIIRQVGSSSTVEHAPGRPGEVKLSLASVEKLAATGFRAVTSFENGLKATIDFFSS